MRVSEMDARNKANKELLDLYNHGEAEEQN